LWLGGGSIPFTALPNLCRVELGALWLPLAGPGLAHAPLPGARVPGPALMRGCSLGVLLNRGSKPGLAPFTTAFYHRTGADL
jgi:hypothetical protein